MGHYAKVVNGTVTEVLVADLEFVQSLPEEEDTQWIKTSYNTHGGVHYDPETQEPSADQSKALRKNYAGIGFRYDADLDAFIPPMDFLTWNLNEETCLWEAPQPKPDDVFDPDGNMIATYHWEDEEYRAGNDGWVAVELGIGS